MKKRATLLVTIAILATACGSRGSDSSSGTAGGSTTTAAPAAAAGDWGDLKGVCGPKEGGGKVAADDAQGVDADTIKLGTIADPGFTGRLGLNQELFDAGDAFVAWCNAAGGINGRKIELTKHDAALTNYRPVMEEACSKDFALVGGGAVQDNLYPEVGAACDLIDVAGFAVTAKKAGVAGQKPSATRTVQPVPNPADRYAVGPALLVSKKYPGVGDRTAMLYADLQTLIDQKNKEAQGFKSIGFDIVHEAAYNINGEANWKPFATAIENAKVTLLKFVGEPVNAGALDQALRQVGYTPKVRLFETNFYDKAYLDAAGPAAEGSFVGSVYAPLEEADTHPATQRYLDIMEKQGGKVALLGLQSTSAWLLFATLAKTCDLDDNLTRSCILEGADAMTKWTGGGLHAPTSPATNEGSPCWMVMEVKDGAFTRWAPTDDEFSCDPSYIASVKPAK